MKRFLLALVISVLTLGAVPFATASAAPYCGITWGSLPKTASPAYSPYVLKDIRTGHHTCYDRMVFDLSGPNRTGWDVRYVSNVYQEGSGTLVPLAGGAKLQVIIKAAAYDDNGNATYPGVPGQKLPNVNLTGYPTFKDAKYAGSFEGQTTVGVGVRARLPFRVFRLDNRIVLDVAHRW